ncbi:MAG: MFS transporter [Gemmatimonadales bacterium]|nr:MFS transporter [Gemmatimonadales bacterium]
MPINFILKFTGIRREETGAALLSSLLFFVILCGYYMVRSLREEMGLAGGVRNLPWLYLANLGVMLALAPVFGAVATRWARRTFVPGIFLFFMSNMLVFFILMKTLPESADILLGRVFYIWISVYNMWAVSLFWAFMADGFGLERSKRLFGFIAVGGTAGAILGAGFTALLVDVVGRANIILVSAVFMLIAAVIFRRLGLLLGLTRGSATTDSAPKAGPSPDRGSALSGIKEFLGSRYLLAIGLYLFLFTLASTFLYFEQAEIVDAAAATREAKTRIFASIDLWVNILTLFAQIFLTGRLIATWGVGRVLLILPAITLIGFTTLGLAPILPVLVVFQVLRRAGNYALAKPARETLYTILDRDQKYKAKSFIDTFVYRGGDMLGASAFAALGSLGIGLSGIAFVAAPPALLWGAVGLFLGRKQNQLAASTIYQDHSFKRPGGIAKSNIDPGQQGESNESKQT